VRPHYSAEGIALTFDTGEAAPEFVRVICNVAKGGFSRAYHIDMPADGKGAKGGDVMSKTHATGSAVTYGRRYLLSMIFNLAVGQDDDGNAAGDTNGVISAEQVAELRKQLKAANADEARFCKYGRVDKLESIKASSYDRALAAIATKARSTAR
jgi:hypothetical protein